MNMQKKYLLGIGFTDEEESKILEFITKGLDNSTEKYYIVTPNPELLVLASKSPKYKSVLNNAQLALPDGIGVILAGILLGKPLKQRITGVDLVENLCKEIAKKPAVVGFLGAKPGIAERTADCLLKKYPDLKVSFAQAEWSDKLKSKKIDILFVAFGSPKQELWIADNLKDLPVKVVVGVGGAFDFISGKIPRAPGLVRALGYEWLFRLIIQPWRIKRQLSLITFIRLVFTEKLKNLSK
jgi:N-acetylglucosaminyldiphosphoundecaprenol N-acetyl-beta-D-mannosaminyltransferase